MAQVSLFLRKLYITSCSATDSILWHIQGCCSASSGGTSLNICQDATQNFYAESSASCTFTSVPNSPAPIFYSSGYYCPQYQMPGVLCEPCPTSGPMPTQCGPLIVVSTFYFSFKVSNTQIIVLFVLEVSFLKLP